MQVNQDLPLGFDFNFRNHFYPIYRVVQGFFLTIPGRNGPRVSSKLGVI